MHPKKVHYAFGDIQTPLPFGAEKLPKWKQVHETTVCEVHQMGETLQNCDGIYTEVANQPIAVVTADCVPILLMRNDSTAVAALHAGWRGTYAQITQAFFKLLQTKKQNPRDWKAVIGPSIQACCYEVSPELIEQFKTKFSDHDLTQFIERDRFLNLVALNTLELLKLGISSVENQSRCTYCSKNDSGEPIFHSFRREKASVRQYSVIEITA